jgi:ketosteroid isomerase-like protein
MSQQTGCLKTVLGRHEEALLRQDAGGIAENHCEDALLVVNGDVYVGRSAIQAFYANLIKSLRSALWHTDRARLINDMVYGEWSCRSPVARVPIGIDTFVVGPDGTCRQTAWFNSAAID